MSTLTATPPDFTPLPPSPWVRRWLETLPEGATVLAQSAQDAAHAFRWGDAVWGLQFHPEFSTGHMRGYIRARSEALANEGHCDKRLAREVSAAPQARRVLRRFVGHAMRRARAARSG